MNTVIAKMKTTKEEPHIEVEEKTSARLSNTIDMVNLPSIRLAENSSTTYPRWRSHQPPTRNQHTG
jgi:hypothetical protein